MLRLHDGVQSDLSLFLGQMQVNITGSYSFAVPKHRSC